MKKLSVATRNILSGLLETEIKAKVKDNAKIADLASLFTARTELESVEVEATEKKPCAAKEPKPRTALGGGGTRALEDVAAT